jgi:hypothetical protein
MKDVSLARHCLLIHELQNELIDLSESFSKSKKLGPIASTFLAHELSFPSLARCRYTVVSARPRALDTFVDIFEAILQQTDAEALESIVLSVFTDFSLFAEPPTIANPAVIFIYRCVERGLLSDEAVIDLIQQIHEAGRQTLFRIGLHLFMFFGKMVPAVAPSIFDSVHTILDRVD